MNPIILLARLLVRSTRTAQAQEFRIATLAIRRQTLRFADTIYAIQHICSVAVVPVATFPWLALLFLPVSGYLFWRGGLLILLGVAALVAAVVMVGRYVQRRGSYGLLLTSSAGQEAAVLLIGPEPAFLRAVAQTIGSVMEREVDGTFEIDFSQRQIVPLAQELEARG